MNESLSYLQMRTVIDSALEGIITINATGEILTMNPSAEKIFGYDRHEALCKNINVLMPEQYRLSHKNYTAKSILSNKTKTIVNGREFVGLNKNGHELPILITVRILIDENSRCFSVFIRDLSDEKLNIQRAYNFEHILETTSNEIYVFDALTLKFIHINHSALSNLQYTFDELKDKTPVDLKPEFNDNSFHELIYPLINNDLKKIDFKTIQQRKDGSTYPTEVHLERGMFENQNAYIAIIIDISEKVAAQEKIRLHEDLLAHMDRISIIGEMTTGIAHELNQPLTAINAYSNAGINRISQAELDINKIKELFEKVGDASHRASEIIARLRLSLKSKSKKMKDLDINKVITESIELIKLDSRSKNFKFILNLSENIPAVIGDPIKIQQVVLNLLRNSIDATTGLSDDINNVVVSTNQDSDENNIVVSISDSGSGIDISDKEKIFNPFFTTKESGLGIGLSICKTIIQSHNGQLWYTSNSDLGVTFHFTLQSALVINNE